MLPRLIESGSKTTRLLNILKDNCFFSLQARGLRYWYKNPGLPFPPNYYKSHQVFYPSLESILREKNQYEKGINMVNVGLDIPALAPVSRRQRREATAAAAQRSNPIIDSEANLTEDELLKMLETKQVKLSYSYDALNYAYLRSKSGISAITDLANHYAIYEHLFSNNLERIADKTLPHKKVDYWPQMERDWTEDELVKFSPGSRKVDPPNLLDVKYFHPVVPMTIEFAVDTDSKSEELTVSPVYRGNHIKPFYTKVKPDVVIDTSLLNGKTLSFEDFQKVLPNGINLLGDSNNFYTLALLNLDSQFGKSDPVCHWMVSNIHNQSDGSTVHKEVISFIPPYAFNGFGYHRYVFMLLQSKEPKELPEINDVELKKRVINLNSLLDKGLTPVGLSWFQSSWDESCRDIFYNILNMREPTYEYIQPKEKLADQAKYPSSAAFNIYLDAYRDPKEMNKEAILERLKEIDPFDYKTIIHPPKLPPNIHPRVPGSNERFAVPSWAWNNIWKKRNKLGRWRHLRNVSAIRPLNNNEDLDYPIWPFAAALRYPSRYPWRHGVRRPHRESKWVIPLNEQPSLRIQDDDIKAQRREEAQRDLKELEKVESKK